MHANVLPRRCSYLRNKISVNLCVYDNKGRRFFVMNSQCAVFLMRRRCLKKERHENAAQTWEMLIGLEHAI